MQPMIVDFHTHIFPPDIRDNRDRYFQNEPAFELLYRPAPSKLVGAKNIVATMDEQRVDYSVVFGFPWKDITKITFQNDYILSAVRKFPNRLVGFCCVDPSHPKAAAEVERCSNAGLSGVGELAFYEKGIDNAALDQLSPIMEICVEKALPVLIHTNEPIGHAYPGKSPITLAEIYRLVKRFPKNKIVLAHWGGGIFFYHLMKKEVKEHFTHVYFDTAASPYLYDAGIYQIAAQIIGAEKILFGSDYPLIPPKRYFKDIEKNAMAPTAIQQICGTNAQQLLHLKGNGQ